MNREELTQKGKELAALVGKAYDGRVRFHTVEHGVVVHIQYFELQPNALAIALVTNKQIEDVGKWIDAFGFQASWEMLENVPLDYLAQDIIRRSKPHYNQFIEENKNKVTGTFKKEGKP